MKPIKDIIYNSLTGSNFSNADRKHLEIVQNWPKIASGLEEHVNVAKIFSDTIILEVYDSSWLQELNLLSSVILKRIQQFYPNISKIKFQKSNKKNYYKELYFPKKNKITPKEENVVKNIKNKELAKALLNYFTIIKS